MLPTKRIDVLDHGYVEYIEHWGSDERIVETARVSTQKGFLGWGTPVVCPRCKGELEHGPWGDSSNNDDNSLRPCNFCKRTGIVLDPPGDEKLLRFLGEQHHDTPFEFAGMQIEVQAPIFVFREWHRHRTQSYSEASARYNPLPDLNYVPSLERLMANSNGRNKQAGKVSKDTPDLKLENAIYEQISLRNEYLDLESSYQRALSQGVPKELARLRLPVGRYSRMRAQSLLRNWLAFLVLRQGSNAQWEIRQYADAVCELLHDHFPRTMSLFDEWCPVDGVKRVHGRGNVDRQ